jgi:hypothetical protein
MISATYCSLIAQTLGKQTKICPFCRFNSKFSENHEREKIARALPGINLIRLPYPEKTYKTWSDFAVSGQPQNTPIFMHILDVFSGQGDRIELIPFLLSQTS